MLRVARWAGGLAAGAWAVGLGGASLANTGTEAIPLCAQQRVRLDRLIVKVRPDVVLVGQSLGARFERAGFSTQSASAAAILQGWGVSSIRRSVHPADAQLAEQLGLDRFYTITLAATPDIAGRAAALGALADLFETVETEGVGRLHGEGQGPWQGDLPRPNDEAFALQYAIENNGQPIQNQPGLAGADVDGLEAWSVSNGGAGVVVAVLDAGIWPQHPDLADQLLPGRNFTSADPNAVVDTWISHGTHIAGVIAARRNNEIGVAGLAHNAKILPVRIVNRFNFTFEEWFAAGLIWAADNGAQVANMSLGFPSASSLQRSAVEYAASLDVVMCASSGNIATDPIGFPAALPETIAVGATNNRDEIAGFTSGGPEMTIAAPGRDIYSTWHLGSAPNTYAYASGTSFASPYAAATAALIRSSRPDLNATAIRGILVSTADDIGPEGWDPFSGAGRVNALAALQFAMSMPMQADGVCGSDLNADGSLNFLDFQIFLQMLTDGAPAADLNNDGQFDFFDLQIFLSRWTAGCRTSEVREP